MKYFSLLLIASLTCIQGFAQFNNLVDFTKTDICNTSNFNGSAVSIFGNCLGMSKAAAIEALKKYHNITWEFDLFNTPSTDPKSLKETRIYVYSKDTAGGKKGESLLYLIWNPGSKGTDRIVFFIGMVNYAVGDTKKLFGTEAITAGSEFYQRFLVKADRHKEETYIIKDTYYNKHLQVIQFKNTGEPNDIYFSLDRAMDK